MSFDGLQRNHFGAILADPPWRFKTWSAKGRDRCPDGVPTRNKQRQNNPERHYATMTMEELHGLPVADVAARDSVLFLWAIDPMLLLDTAQSRTMPPVHTRKTQAALCFAAQADHRSTART